MADDPRSTVIRDVAPETVIEIMSEGAVKITLDYNEYGTVELNLHPGAMARLITGIKAPRIISHAPDNPTLEGDNIFRIDEKKPDYT